MTLGGDIHPESYTAIKQERDALKAEIGRLRAELNHLRLWARKVLTLEIGMAALGTSQPLVVEQLLPDELIVDKDGARELVWEQGEPQPYVAERDALKAEVERLRKDKAFNPDYEEVANEYAEDIAKLREELNYQSDRANRNDREREQMRAEKEAAQGMWGNMALGDAADKLYRAEQERDALKTALENIRKHHPVDDYVQRTADDALAKLEEK